MRKTRKNRQSTKNIFVTIQDYILCLIGNLINNKTLKLRCNHSKTANRTYNNHSNSNFQKAIQKSRKNQVLQTLKNVHSYPGGVEETKE